MKKPVNVLVDEDLWRFFGVGATLKGITKQAALEEALIQYLTNEGIIQKKKQGE